MRRPPFGTAQREVLLKLTDSHYSNGTWSLLDGTALYENRALTDALCQSLVRLGFLDEAFKGQHSVYTVTAAGKNAADRIRMQREGFRL